MKASLPAMLNDLRRLFPESPSWPFRTVSARTVWSATEAAFDADPTLLAPQAVRFGFIDSGIPSIELTPEDLAILGMAARWKEYVVRERRKPQQANPVAVANLRMQQRSEERAWHPRSRSRSSLSSPTRR